MTNKTLDSKIVVPGQGFGTIACHALIVVNERDGGRVLQQIVPPDQKFRKPLLVRGTLVPYHVTLDEFLRDSFICKLHHADGLHSFSLQFDVHYRVVPDSPHVPVLRLEVDPLGSVEEEIKRILSAPIRSLDWSVILDHPNLTRFATDANSIDDCGALIGNMERIRIYGRSFGIEVRQIAISRHLEAVDLEISKSANEVAKQATLRDHTIQGIYDKQREDEARLIVDHNLATTGALQGARTNTAKTFEAYAAGARTAVGEIAQSAKSFSEIASQLRQVKEVVELAHGIIPGSTNGHESTVKWIPLLPSSSSASPQLGSGASAELAEPPRNADDVLARAHEVAAALPIPEPERRRFLAAVLRLQAARMADASDDEIEKHRADLAELHRAHAQNMRDEHSSFIAGLVRPRRPIR